jgi:hypothetical protein
MTLHDGDVAALARQAVELLAPDIDIAIDPEAGADPYRFGAPSWEIWPLVDGRRSFGVHVLATDAPAPVLARLVDAMSENVSETSRYWGVAFPACPGHPHPADVEVDGAEVTLTCPGTGAEIARLQPFR